MVVIWRRILAFSLGLPHHIAALVHRPLANTIMDPVTKRINRDNFKFQLPIVETHISVTLFSKCSHVIKKLQFDNLDLRSQRVDLSDSKVAIKVMLDPDKVKRLVEILSEEDKKKLVQFGIVNNDNDTLCDSHYTSVPVTYEECMKDYIFKRLLPEGQILSGHTMVGHILHVNLRDCLQPYKFAIGDVLLDKIKQARTVVNKVNNIDSAYRHFEMELLAGEENFVTKVHENEFDFHMDFSKVYWNTRLCTEHQRVLNELQGEDVLYDACAGIGPFSVPAAIKKGCHVLANDLNPESIHWLRHNIVVNTPKRQRFEKVFCNETWAAKTGYDIRVYQLDAMDFITNVALPHMSSFVRSSVTRNGKEVQFVLVMNLPAMATQFLAALRPVALPYARKPDGIPLQIRCYCFLRLEDVRDNAVEVRVSKELAISQYWVTVVNLLGFSSIEELDEKRNLRYVRNVAPGKDMFCASFEVPLNIAVADNAEGERDAKVMRLA